MKKKGMCVRVQNNKKNKKAAQFLKTSLKREEGGILGPKWGTPEPIPDKLIPKLGFKQTCCVRTVAGLG